jgi:hypothetical protein
MTLLMKTMRGLESAEEILSFFRIPFDPAVVNVHRMRILREAHARLHDENGAEDDDALYARMRSVLMEVYERHARGAANGSALPDEPGPAATARPQPPARAFVPLDDVIGVARMRRPAPSDPTP